MARTIQDVNVSGRTEQEIKSEIVAWMQHEGVEMIEGRNGRDGFFKGRLGLPAGLGLTAAKFFEISLRSSSAGCITVHTEGWIGNTGLVEQSFSKGAFVGAIPRRKGWEVIERLWIRLQGMSKTAFRFCLKCGRGATEEAKFCTHCGTPFN
jgi:hypothetical protein